MGVGITMPGVCVWPAGIGVILDCFAFGSSRVGINIPKLCVCPVGVGVTLSFLTFAFWEAAFRLIFRFDLRFAVVFGFGLLAAVPIPGIVCPSCCASTVTPGDVENNKTSVPNRNKCLYDLNTLFMISLLKFKKARGLSS